MSKGPFDSLNIYYPYGLRKSGFKNTICNRPLLRPENFYQRYNIWGDNISKKILDKYHLEDSYPIPILARTISYHGAIRPWDMNQCGTTRVTPRLSPKNHK